MPANQRYSSTAVQALLSGAITNVAVSANVNTTSGFPTLTGSDAFTGVIDIGLATQEIVDCTNVTGLTLTITRGVDGSTAQAHANQATFTHAYIGRDAREARLHIDAASGVHGLAGGVNVVGDTATQTLTNKTLSGATLSGTMAGSPTWSGAQVFPGATISTGNQLTVDSAAVKPIAGPQWQSYVPVLGGTGSALGNGTLTGNYVQYGKLTFFEIFFVLGSTSSLGTSATTLTLPLTPASYSFAHGFYGIGAGNFYTGVVASEGTTTGSTTLAITVKDAGGTGTNVALSKTVPQAQAAGFVLYLQGFYQATT